MADNATVLVTGGTGFIGRYVVRLLLAENRKVRLLCRNAEKALTLFGEAVDVAPGDLCDPVSLDAACKGVGTVLHLAGQYDFGPQHKTTLWRTNVLGASNLLSACWNSRV